MMNSLFNKTHFIQGIRRFYKTKLIVGMAGGKNPASRAVAKAKRRGNYDVSDDEFDIYDYANNANTGSLPNSFTRSSAGEFMKPRRALEGPMKPRNPAQERYFSLLESFSPPIVIGSGPAGTGKSSIAVSMGIQQLNERNFEKIVISRPAVTVDEEHGFLPGDLTEKMAPWMQPLYDTFYKYYSPDQVKSMIAQNTIEICPLAYLRGRTFTNSFIIIDEAQNCTQNQMLMILTRIGNGSKMVITGDPMQHDRGFEKNGLTDLLQRLNREPVKSIEHVEFSEEDVERHPVIKSILKLYKNN